MFLLNGWIGERVMSGLYEELRDLIKHEKAAALATVVRGEEYAGAKLLVLPNKSVRGTLGDAALDALVVEDAERAIWTGEAGTRTYAVEGPEGAQAFDVFIEGFPPLPTLVIVGAGSRWGRLSPRGFGRRLEPEEQAGCRGRGIPCVEVCVLIGGGARSEDALAGSMDRKEWYSC